MRTVLIELISPRRRALTFGVLTATALGMAWLLACSRQQTQVSWIHTSLVPDVVSSFIRVGFTAPLSRMHEQPALACSMAFGALVACATLAQALRRTTRWTTMALWACSVVPPLAVTCGLIVGVDLYAERYFTPSSIAISLLIGSMFAPLLSHATRPDGQRAAAAASGIALAFGAGLSAPILASSHARDGHWGEDLGVHRAALEGSEDVWFVAPRNRATLFSGGELAQRWRNAPWWQAARARGGLWGPPQAPPPAPVGQLLVVTDTRRLSALRTPASCASQHILTREARATVVALTCRAPASPTSNPR